MYLELETKTAADTRLRAAPSRAAAGARGLGHLPWLDGIRGVAILGVLAYHFFAPLRQEVLALKLVGTFFSLGWLGVDLFFVLSGFLITRNLLADRGPTTERLFRFWTRRTLRIFPIYYAFLTAWSAYNVLYHRGIVAWPYWTYTANWWQSFHSEEVTSGLSHLWSLAVEEQFYLLWPFVVIAVGVRAERFAISFVVLAFVVRLATRTFVPTPYFWMLLYRSTLTRGDSLMAGALVAFSLTDAHREKRTNLWTRWAPAVALALLAADAAVVLKAKGLRACTQTVQVYGYTLFALTFAAAIWHAASMPEGSWSAGLGRRVLATSWLREIGRVSYAMYLFHWPIAAAAWSTVEAIQVGRSALGRFVVVSACALAESIGTYGFAWLS